MIATILAQTENRPKTTNGPHVVSNFTQKKFIAARFPEKNKRRIQNVASAFVFQTDVL